MYDNAFYPKIWLYKLKSEQKLQNIAYFLFVGFHFSLALKQNQDCITKLPEKFF